MARLRKVYLTNYSQENDLALFHLNDSAKTFCGDIEVLDIRNFLDLEGDYSSNEDLLYQVLVIVKDNQQFLEFYKSVEGSIAFAKQLLKLLKTLESYRVKLEDYPVVDAASKDIYFLLGKLKDLKTYEKALIKKFKVECVDNITVYNYQTDSPLEREFLAQFPNCLKQELKPQIRCFQALNLNNEVEWIAQDIIKRGLSLQDVRISCGKKDHQTLDFVLKQYNLAKTSSYNGQLIKFLKLVNQGYKKGFDIKIVISLAQILIKDTWEFNHYLKLMKLPFEGLFEPFDHLKQRSYLNLQSVAETTRIAVLEFLLPIIQIKYNSYQEYAKGLYALGLKYFEGDETLLAIRNSLQTISLDLSEYYYEMVEYLLDNIEPRLITKLNVTDKRAFNIKKYHYSIGNQSDTFLSNYLFNDLLSEEQANILALPSALERLIIERERSSNSFLAYSELTITFSSLRLDGKAQEKSLELLQHFDIKAENIEIIKPSLPIYPQLSIDYNLSLDHNTSYELFTDKGVIRGSVSSFERYSNCAYSYFLRTGLRIKEPLDYELSPKNLGTLIHNLSKIIIEDEINTHVFDIIKSVVVENFEHIELFKYRPGELEIFIKFITYQLINSFKAYKLIEDEGKFRPMALEDPFQDLIIEENEVKIQINGFIDRIDEYNNNLIIKDYKTGKTKFKIEEFVYGLSLQLPTYAFAVEKKYGKNVIGAYYLDLANTIINEDGYKITVKDGLERAQRSESIYKDYRYNGINFECDEETLKTFVPNFKGVKGIRKTKKLITNSFSHEELFSALIYLYKEIANRLMLGDISINPFADACKYCEYRSICQFKGGGKKAPYTLYNMDNKGVVDSDALAALVEGKLRR